MPKQCLALTSERTLLQETVDRVVPLVGSEHVLVVTGPDMAPAIREQLSELPEGNVLVEPSGRNTAPCIAWATVEVARRGGRTLAVLPSDHGIADVPRFREVLSACFDAAEDSGRMVLLGQTPTRPETGYGYLRVGEPQEHHGGEPFNGVARFIEKPNREAAERMLREGGVLWNGGMFVWTVDAVTAGFDSHLPRTAAAMRALHEGTAIDAVWTQMDATSIDYGVLEHCREELLVVPCAFGWTDLGSWPAVAPYLGQGELGAAQVGAGVAIDGGGHIVYAPEKLVATLGVEDLIIVDTPDVLLVTRRDAAQRIPELLKALKARGAHRYL